MNASAFRSDGVRLWPDSLAHVVGRHDALLPDAFVAHVRARGYAPPAVGPALGRAPALAGVARVSRARRAGDSGGGRLLPVCATPRPASWTT